MSDETKRITDEVALRGYLAEELPKILAERPEVVIAALADNPDLLRGTLEEAGFRMVPRKVTGEDVSEALTDARRHRIVDSGFGSRARSRCVSRKYVDPVWGERLTFIVDDETETLAEEWFYAYFTPNLTNETSGRTTKAIYDELEKRTVGERAPADPFIGDLGAAGGSLVPTVIAAEIFEIMNERFPLRGMIQTFQSNTPLEINRRTVEAEVTRGGTATDITEDKPEVGPVRLSPERVGVLTYIDPKLAQASPVGVVRWVTEQLAEAMAKDDQRVIIAGQQGNREPRGLLNLPTSGGNAFDRAATNAYNDSSILTERASMKEAFYSIPQKHRQRSSFTWITNDDGLRELHSHNDQDQRPFGEALADGQNESYLRKMIVESGAIVTSGGDTQIIGSDLNQYAWLEGSEGLKLAVSDQAGRAWESDTIAVKAVQYVDGAPITPPATVIITSVDV